MTEPETPDLPAAVRRFGEAWAAGDTAVLEALVAPGYAHVDASGALLDRAPGLPKPPCGQDARPKSPSTS